ncbi:MAG: hypothetical protein ACI319_09175 [Holdemanella porci]
MRIKKLSKLVVTLGVGMSLALPVISATTVLADNTETATFKVNENTVNTQGLFDQKTMIKQAGSEYGIGGGSGAAMDYNNPKAWPHRSWCPHWWK